MPAHAGGRHQKVFIDKGGHRCWRWVIVRVDLESALQSLQDFVQLWPSLLPFDSTELCNFLFQPSVTSLHNIRGIPSAAAAAIGGIAPGASEKFIGAMVLEQQLFLSEVVCPVGLFSNCGYCAGLELFQSNSPEGVKQSQWQLAATQPNAIGQSVSYSSFVLVGKVENCRYMAKSHMPVWRQLYGSICINSN